MLKNKHLYPILKPAIRFIKFRILHVDDSPHSLAMGVGLGLFIAWTPAIGFHMLIALFMSFLFKANKFLTVSLVWISNIFTLIPVYLPSYLLGREVLKLFNLNHGSTKEQFVELLKKLSSFRIILDIWTSDFWVSIFDILLKIGLPLWIGSIIIGLFLGLAGYILTYRLILWHRLKHPHRRTWKKRAINAEIK